jgi:hypothetical protein
MKWLLKLLKRAILANIDIRALENHGDLIVSVKFLGEEVYTHTWHLTGR